MILEVNSIQSSRKGTFRSTLYTAYPKLPMKGKKKKKGDEDFLDENGKPLVGTVDDRGYLVTQGPKKRLLVRLLQVVLAAGAAVPGIYAAAVRGFSLYAISSRFLTAFGLGY